MKSWRILAPLLVSVGICQLFSIKAHSHQIISAPPAICALSYSTPDGVLFCSGTLISPNAIVTASHCFSGGPKRIVGNISVGCGLQRQNQAGEGFVFAQEAIASAVRVNTEDTTAVEAGEDFAFLKLSRDIRMIEPMRVPASFDQFKAEFLVPSPSASGSLEMKPAVECRMSGFGVPQGSHRRFFVTSDHSPKNGLKAFFAENGAQAKTMVVHAWGSEIEEMRSGDSGGGFYCRSAAGDPWTLVAVNVSVSVLVKSGISTGMRKYAATASDSFQGFWRTLRAQWR